MQNNMKINWKSRWKELAIAILIPLIVGSVSSLCTIIGINDFEALAKPPLTPGRYLFPIVWSALYIIMGVSSFMIYESSTPAQQKAIALSAYAIQLVFNAFFTLLFFNFKAYLLAFLWLLLLFVLICLMIYSFYPISKPAALMQIPYMLWVIFAGYLNFMICLMNR